MQVLPLALKFIEEPEMLENIYVYDEEVIKGMIKIFYDRSNHDFEIEELYIDPFFQKQSIGEQLLEHAEKIASALGFSDIVLWVLEKNLNARNFYTKHGFIYTSDKKLEEGTTEFILKYNKLID